jgi:hypothetical protein
VICPLRERLGYTELRLDDVSRRRVGAGDDGAGSDSEGVQWGDPLVRAVDILGLSPRTLRRWRERYEKHGYVGLVDKRRHSPSVRLRSSGCSGSTGSGIAASMSGTFTRLRGASTVGW